MNNCEEKNAIVYVRVSSQEQVDGTSLESQERLCKEFAKREGMVVIETFIERGESAKTADRTEFIKAIAFCSQKRHKISYFIVYKIDRFSRNQTDYAVIKQKLKGYGTEIRSVSEKIDDSPSGKLMEVMLAGFAEFDNNVRTERSVGGMKERIRQGVWVWQAPLGYYRPYPGSNIVKDPKFAPFIQMIFEEYARGIHTYESLAAFINGKGFLSKKGNGAIPQLIQKILRNHLYHGSIRKWGIEAKGTFEPIIDETLFYRCQPEGKNTRNVSHTIVNHDFPLRRIVVCSVCNEPLTGSSSRGRTGAKYAYYHHHHSTCSESKSIPKENFERLFVELLQKIQPTLKYKDLFSAAIREIWDDNCRNLETQHNTLQREISDLKSRRQRVFELHQAGTYTDDEFLVQKDIISKRIAVKESVLREGKIDDLNVDNALEGCVEILRDPARMWMELEDKPIRRLAFQKSLFSESIPFANGAFGTAKLAASFRISQENWHDKSTLVTLCRQNWNRIIHELKIWNVIKEGGELEVQKILPFIGTNP